MKKLVKESLNDFLNEGILIKDEREIGLAASDVDPKEFLVGIEVEKEHSSNLAVRKIITLQHLSDNPKYYSEGMKKGMFEEPAAINTYKKYFIDKEEVADDIDLGIDNNDDDVIDDMEL